MRIYLQASEVFYSLAGNIKSTRTSPVVEHLTAFIGSEDVKIQKLVFTRICLLSHLNFVKPN